LNGELASQKEIAEKRQAEILNILEGSKDAAVEFRDLQSQLEAISAQIVEIREKRTLVTVQTEELRHRIDLVLAELTQVNGQIREVAEAASAQDIRKDQQTS
jgi:uncharacterized coiled-coil DUF342 family protein